MARNRYYDGPQSDHYDGVRFFNPGQPPTDRALAELLRWRFLGKRETWAAEADRSVAVWPAERVAGCEVTMIGHASILIQVAGLNVLVDPVWSDRAGPGGLLGPRRANSPGISFEHLPPIDTVLVSHNHYDHLDAKTLARLVAAHRPRIIAPLGNDAVILHAVPGSKVETGDWGDRFELGAGVVVTLHPAHHWSARGIGDRRMALWCGFVIETPAVKIYVAGDTAYGDGEIFRQVRRDFGPPALAVLPIGAYEPRWFMRSQHVNPEEAVRIMQDCGARQALGVHWGTFQLTDEARMAPADGLRDACLKQGIDPARFAAFRPGDVWVPALCGEPIG